MSKKTKKQKLLAKLHRQQQLLSVHQTSYVLPATPSISSAPDLPSGAIGQPIALVVSDLRQTVVLTLLAICAQLVLWYLLEIRHLKLF